ncbi:hypothetical protein [Nostoc sp. LEGE 12450]|uniref:hypothetical protein n=1 Tax=Nostoc sp. LEGE 12450 TaxID=1828643 RepID=UPI001882A7FC|nr:hypothetical protein [Nostoc sp. LEGE 12450]MBE8992464.1 hypothetical protein [Nostoc sp. LEGE 12450]
MGWNYDGRGNPSPATKARQSAARRAACECAKARRNLERYQRQREAEQRHKQRQSALTMRELAKELVDHPLVNILLATLEGWQDAE